MSALSIAFYRGWIGVLWALGFVYLRGDRLTWSGFRASVWGGVALGIELMCFFTAIKLTTIATVAMVEALTPVVLLFAAPMLLGERVRLPDVLAAAVAIVGAGMVASGSTQLPQWHPIGALFAVLTLLTWSAYLVVSKLAQESVQPTEFTAWVTLVAAVVITPAALFLDDRLAPPSDLQTVAALVFMALSGWVGHVLMNWSLGHIPVWVGGTCTLAVDVLSSVLAVVLLGERMVPIESLGVLIVVAALTTVSLRSSRVAATPDEAGT